MSGIVSKPIRERFEAKYIPEPMSGCWIWTDNLNYYGYGQIKVGSLRDHSRTNWTAHRLAWVLYRGPIPPTLLVCHHCDNRACVNPYHLFIGTVKDNMVDHVLKERPHGSKKLTIAQVKAILTSVESNNKIAKQYGLSKGYVWRIKKRKKWASITL